jgi:hypothetical protein
VPSSSDVVYVETQPFKFQAHAKLLQEGHADKLEMALDNWRAWMREQGLALAAPMEPEPDRPRGIGPRGPLEAEPAPEPASGAVVVEAVAVPPVSPQAGVGLCREASTAVAPVITLRGDWPYRLGVIITVVRTLDWLRFTYECMYVNLHVARLIQMLVTRIRYFWSGREIGRGGSATVHKVCLAPERQGEAAVEAGEVGHDSCCRRRRRRRRVTQCPQHGPLLRVLS